MKDLILADKAANWQRLKALVLDSVSSPITKRVYNLGLDEFIEWFGKEPRPGFTKAQKNSSSARRVFLKNCSSGRPGPGWPEGRYEKISVNKIPAFMYMPTVVSRE